MEDILLPSKLQIIPGKNENEAVLEAEPFFQGYGTTIGNALRRVLLSSLPGAAVTAVKIKGAQHEFMSLPHVKEDVLEIILNLKLLRLKIFGDEPTKLTLKVKGEKKITAADIDVPSNVEIANPDLLIATLTDKKAELEMEIHCGRGRGYVPTEERTEKMEIGTIAIDALYSPVRNVGLKIEHVRVGQITNFDKLILFVETDGTMTPKEAILQAVNIILNHFNLFLGLTHKETVSESEGAGLSAEGSKEVKAAEEKTGGAEEEKAEKPKKKRVSSKKKI